MLYRGRQERLYTALTFLEMVIALAIMAVVFAAVLPEFRVMLNSWDSKAGAAEALQNGRILMDHLHYSLSRAARITGVSDSAQTNGYIEFEDNGGTILRYDIGANSYVQFGPAGDLSDLAGPVSQLKFTCYDACDLDTPIMDINQIRSVRFEASLLSGAVLGQDKNFVGQAYLRTNATSFSGSVTPGVAVSDDIEVESAGCIDAISGTAVVSTNSTGNHKIKVKDSGVINGDVFVGPGGDPEDVIDLHGFGQITGSTGTLSDAVYIWAPAEPSLGGSVGDRVYDGFETKTISSDLHCDKFEIMDFAKVNINGNVTILAEKEFQVQDFGQLKLLADATLTLYTKDKFEAKNFGQINVNTADYSRFRINHLANEKIEISNSCQLYATLVAPNGELCIKNMAQFYGTFQGEKVKVENFGQLHTVSSSSGARILP